MEKEWTVYILECGDGTLYTGITDDLPRRLKAHQAGKGAKYTRGRGLLILRYRETLPDKSAALRRELAIKRLRKSEKLAMIHEYRGEMLSSLEISPDGEYTEEKKENPSDKGREEEAT